jgi:hypothetical protein
MDFLERFFGFSPDGGDGSMEVLIIIALLLVVASISTSVWLGRNQPGRDAK